LYKVSIGSNNIQQDVEFNSLINTKLKELYIGIEVYTIGFNNINIEHLYNIVKYNTLLTTLILSMGCNKGRWE
jgi:hypothetical protein